MKHATVLYWVSRAIRTHDNQAFYQAQQIALTQNAQLIVLFNAYPKYPYANRRNMDFLLKGLAEMSDKCSKLNIPLYFRIGNIIDHLETLNQTFDIQHIITETHVLRPIMAVQALVSNWAYAHKVRFIKVNTATVVPVQDASPKLEFAARTFRPKILKKYKDYLNSDYTLVKHPQQILMDDRFKPSDIETFYTSTPLKQLSISNLVPGEDAAIKQLNTFIHNGLDHYDQRNRIDANGQSYLSAYLHFGMLSPIKMIRDVLNTQHPNAELFIEEAMVRRELAENYCFYEPNYDKLDGAWSWAIETLKRHENDERPYLYSRETLEKAQTHDDLWNHCQRLVVDEGYLHSYLRMYWAKMVLLWTKNASEAIDILVYLNDTYMLDGRDPNGYTGILWSVAGVHDRPWFDRPVFGLIRTMGKEGSDRKSVV